MSHEDLLRYANENKPADFTREFKSKVDVLVKQKLSPKSAVQVEPEESDQE
jgi:hypothetical protein